MKSNKIILRIALVLLVLNLVVLGILLMPKPQGPPIDDRPKNLIIEKLGFDKEQAEAYQELIDEHRRDIFEQEKKIRELKHDLYELLKESNSSLEAELISTRIGTIQSQIEMIHFNHFKDIRDLCREDQLPKFDELSKELAKIFSRRPPNKNRP